MVRAEMRLTSIMTDYAARVMPSGKDEVQVTVRDIITVHDIIEERLQALAG